MLKVGHVIPKGIFLWMLLGSGVTAQETGTVSGFLDHRWVQRYPALVYLETEPPASVTPPDEEYRVDQRDMTFVPRVAGVLQGQTVRFLNSDFVRHNVYSTRESATPNLSSEGTFGTGDSFVVKLETLGVVQFRCNLHSQMVAYLVVRDNPYFSVTQEGRYTIGEVPPGRYIATFFHEKLEPRRVKISLAAGEELVLDFDLKTTSPPISSPPTEEPRSSRNSTRTAEDLDTDRDSGLPLLVGLIILAGVSVLIWSRGRRL